MYTQKETIIIDNSNMKLSYRETRNVKNGYGTLENYPYQYIIKGKLKKILQRTSHLRIYLKLTQKHSDIPLSPLKLMTYLGSVNLLSLDYR